MENARRVVLFCDISGFMRLTLSLADRMPGFVQAYYEMVGDAVVGMGGRLVKYIGDGVLCLFPDGRETDAVRCALRMRGDFSRLLEKYAPGDAARLSSAISSGEVVLGRYGHATLRTEDVMGEVVSEASVLNGCSGITVTKRVHDAAASQIRMQEIPPVPLKWSKTPLQAWQVIE